MVPTGTILFSEDIIPEQFCVLLLIISNLRGVDDSSGARRAHCKVLVTVK